MNRVRKRIILCLFIFTLVFLSSDVVLAEAGSCGEVRYDITDFNINNEKITIKGWAFISCTQNYTEYNGGDSTIKKTGGGQKIKIRAIDENGNQVGNVVEVNGSNTPRNYNFIVSSIILRIKRVSALRLIMVHFLHLVGIMLVRMEFPIVNVCIKMLVFL